MRVETTEAHAPSGSAPQQEQPAQREVRLLQLVSSLCAAAKTQCGQKVRDFSKRNGVRNFRLLGWLDSSQELWPGSSGSGAGRHSSGGCDPEQVTLYLPSEQSVQTLTSSFLGTY